MLDAPALDRLLGAIGEADSGIDAARSRVARRAAGAYFTPAPLVELVVDRAVALLCEGRELDWRDDGSPRIRLLDPAAGDGRFLGAAIDRLAALSPRTEIPRRQRARAIARRCAVAVERDGEFAALARERLGGAEVRCLEALGAAGELGRFDLIVSNPPYLRSIRLGESDEALRQKLRGRYRATSFGEWDLYAAFIEQSLEWLAPGGAAGLVVPSRWMTARFARGLRAELAERRAVRAVVDFASAQLFAEATTYSSLLFLGAGADEIEVARLGDGGWSLGRVTASELDGAPWRLAVGAERESIERLERAGPRLGEIARIVKGTGTNADRSYVFEDREPPVEPAMVRRCLRGRDVVAWGAATDRVRCLLPYTPAGALIEPGELARRYPRARRYLESQRDILESRERGRFAGERFYQFGRPQNLELLCSGAAKVVIPDVARESRALLDRSGALVLDSAYAVVPHRPEDAALILAVFNSPAPMMWLRATGVPLRGGYRRMKTAYLLELPVPDPDSAATADVVAAVEAGAEPGAIGARVRRAYGVPPAEWRRALSPAAATG